MEFYAAFKGVDINQHSNEAKERFEAIEKRAQERLAGKSDYQIELDEFSDLGLDFEVI